MRRKIPVKLDRQFYLNFPQDSGFNQGPALFPVPLATIS